MRFESELATAFNSCNTFHTFEKYAELLSPELIQQGFEQAQRGVDLAAWNDVL